MIDKYPALFVAALIYPVLINICLAETTVYPADRRWSDTNGWLIYKNTRLRGCFAEKRQDDGSVFLLGVFENGNILFVGLASERLTPVNDGEYLYVKLLFDGERSWNTAFKVLDLNGRKLLYGMNSTTERLRNEVARSKHLTFSYNKVHMAQVLLEDSGGTLNALDKCYRAVPEKGARVGQSTLTNQKIAESDRLNDNAIELSEAGRYTEAHQLHQRALTIREEVLGPEHAKVADSVNNLGIVLAHKGEYDVAELHFRRALSIREKVLGPFDPNLADSLNNLGNVLREKGDYDGAEPPLRRALVVLEKVLGPDHPSVGRSLNGLANLLADKGDHDQAELLYRRSLAIGEKAHGPGHPRVGERLNNLALLLADKGDHDEAELLYRRSLAILENVFGPDNPRLGRGLNNLANLLGDTGDYSGAERLHQRALAIRETAFGPHHPDVGDSLTNLAIEHLRKGDYSGAEGFYRRALAIKEKAFGPEHPEVGDILNNLASLLNAKGEPDEALVLASKAAQSGNPKRSVFLSAIDNAGLPPVDELSESFVAVQQTASVSAGSALHSLAARFGAGSGELARLVRDEQDQAAEVAQLEKAILTEISKTPEERDANREKAIRSRTDELKESLRVLRKRLSREFPEYAELSRPETLSIKEAQSLLADDEALVVIDVAATGEGSDYVWSVTSRQGSFQRLDTRPGEIAGMIAELRKSLDLYLHLARKPIDPDLAYRLHEKLLGPVANEIRGKSHLIFVLNGAVSSLPPHVLVSAAPETGDYRTARWLVRDHAITVLPTVSSLKILRSKAVGIRAPKPFRGYGDPVFNPERDGTGRQVASRNLTSFFDKRNTDIDALREYLPRLPATATEVKRVAESLGASPDEVVLREKATEAAVKQANLSEYNIIYFATHGLVAGDVAAIVDSGAEPALAFTVPDKASALDDGLLTASEVAQLDLNADWVVLSACNTAAGGEPGAEALSGLARAFFYAGTRSLLVSHWVVDDDATAELMSRTFAHASGNPTERPAEALRQAMLYLMDDTDHPEWADPAYWAPFILVGEPRWEARRGGVRGGAGKAND